MRFARKTPIPDGRIEAYLAARSTNGPSPGLKRGNNLIAAAAATQMRGGLVLA